MQDLIAANLDGEPNLADLARVAGYSPWYAHRLFTRLVGCTPATYVRKLRLSASARRLREGSVRVADVAFEMGFASVDGYQRAFLREFGCNPHEYAVSPVPLYLFVPYGVRSRYQQRGSTMEKDETSRDVATVFVQAQERPARKAVIKRGVAAHDYWGYCDEVGCDVWGLLTSMDSIVGEPVCLWLPPAMIEPGTSEYVQGVEVAPDWDGRMPEGFDVIDLPAATYLRFQGEPFAEEDYERAIDQVWRAMERYDPSLVGYAWDDTNPRIQLEPRGERGYVELRAVRAA